MELCHAARREAVRVMQEFGDREVNVEGTLVRSIVRVETRLDPQSFERFWDDLLREGRMAGTMLFGLQIILL